MRALILFFTSSLVLSAGQAPDFPAALSQAKSTKSPVAVLVHGSDWNKPGEVLMKSWVTAEFAKSIGESVVRVAVNRKENPSDADKELAKKNEACKLPYRSLPALGLYDADGRLVAVRSGLAEIRDSGGLELTVKTMLRILSERDALWARAQSASGLDKATFLGKGLDRMNQGLGHGNCYQPVLEEIRKADPNDQSGYVGKYSFSPWSLLGMVMDKAGKSQHAEAEQELAKWAKNQRLNSRQRQELCAARFALYQRWPEKKESCAKVLEEMRDLDPKSEIGVAAAGYLKMIKGS